MNRIAYDLVGEPVTEVSMETEILGICGSPVKGGNTEVFLREALKAAAETSNVNTNLISLSGKEIRSCRHCNWCLRKQEVGKPCVQEDGMVEIFPEIVKADALLLATPVYVNRLSGYLACFLDRFRAFAMGNVYRGKLRNKVGGALAVAWFRNRGAESALLSIISAFLAFEMIVVAPPKGLGSPYGAAGLSSEGGTGKFSYKNKLGILEDEYGLRGARALGKRVAEITQLIKVGSQR